MPAPTQQKFFEIIKPGSNYEFIGRQKYWIGLSIALVTLTCVMLPLNAFVFKSRGHMLNWGVDFRGGSEIVVEFSKPVEAGEVRKTLADAGFADADVVKYADPAGLKKWNYMIRVAAVSVVSEQQAKQIQTSLAKVADASLQRFEWAEGGDKLCRAELAGELAQGAGRQQQPGADLRSPRRLHLRGDAGRAGHRDPPRARRAAR
jgi:preprotein translocase subunit SecF